MAEENVKAINKRKAVSLSQKIEIITKLQNGAANAAICREYKLSKSTVSTVWANKEKYLSVQHVNSPSTKKLRGSSKPEVDQSLLKWFSLKRSQNIPISGPILQAKAAEFEKITKTLNTQESQEEPGSSSKEIEYSRGWIDRFKRRYDIQSGKIHGESASVSLEVTNQWINTVWPGLRSKYEKCDTFNGDETGLFFKLTPDRTLKFKGDKCSGGKLSKERITVFVCSNMDGSEKRRLVVIGKSASPRCFKATKNLPVTYYSNKRAWITSEIFEKILRDWDTELEKRKRKILLLVDNCPAHPKVLNLKRIELIFLPPNVTAVLQPMDQGVIRSLKSHYRQQLLFKLIRALDSNNDLKITLLDAVMMLVTAWGRVSSTTILNCFRHAGLDIGRDAFDEDDDIPLALWIEKERSKEIDNIPDLNEWAKSNSITDFDDFNLTEYATADDNLVVAEFPSDAEIVSSVSSQIDIESEELEKGEDSTEGENQRELPTTLEALDSLETVNKFLRFNNPTDDCINALELIHGTIQKSLLEKRKKQTKVTEFFKL
ncbi:tigger transposable element-derived protein 4-like [Photinus pyralis]|uniref:HTH CENPB-type domain-containing protein n=1 Tax=Photinus pyralis TaxID=7054 RepID=A0A1Y1KNY0_PHOPY|nr:tigger transposable element-derived protein 4-like [Photinus pyralis]XP_031346391.1 tigger transposable element-derived protein 4-like [Photinus pyralis]